MDLQTISTLNQLNQTFYQTVAQDFSNTRNYSWPGWEKLLPSITELLKNKKTIRVLDLGCGNGRFALFLAQHFAGQIDYLGLDSDEQLLSIAQKKLSDQNIKTKFEQFDLVENLLNQQLTDKLTEKFDLIVMFGVIHHLPALQLRQQLMSSLNSLLNHDGLLIFSCWQFAKDERFKDRVVDPKNLKIDPQNLEHNDYILDWKQGQTAYRYCHFVDEQELANLTNSANWQTQQTFLADGKSGQLNLYWVGELGK